jgi:hypothetical protein
MPTVNTAVRFGLVLVCGIAPVLVNPSGLTTVDSVNGVAVLNAPVSASGSYTVKVINVSLSPCRSGLPRRRR